MDRRALLAVLLLAPAAAAQDVSDAEKKEGFVPIFNGKDFSGWRFGESAAPGKQPDNWKVADGLIKLSGGGNPHLASQWEFDDFELRLEWRAAKAGYNSGVYVRSGRAVNANQINLAQKDAGHLLGGPPGAKAVPDLQKPPGEWNEWRVRAVGDKLAFWCNGQSAWEIEGFKPRHGYLGLQAEGAAVDFRNIRIHELGCERLDDPKQWTGGEWTFDAGVFKPKPMAKPVSSVRKDFKDGAVRLEWKAEKGAPGTVRFHGATVNIGGTLVGSGPTLVHPQVPKKLEVPPGEWNYLEVRVHGGKVGVWLNGGWVVEGVPLAKDAPGAGGLEIDATDPSLQVRNVRVKELKE
jgi:hypothetical protein